MNRASAVAWRRPRCAASHVAHAGITGRARREGTPAITPPWRRGAVVRTSIARLSRLGDLATGAPPRTNPHGRGHARHHGPARARTPDRRSTPRRRTPSRSDRSARTTLPTKWGEIDRPLGN